MFSVGLGQAEAPMSEPLVMLVTANKSCVLGVLLIVDSLSVV